ncbi:sensor histidine kinase [Vibrio diazotrophicus]|uniref:histidine kinase n=1 Tax=Vibrio diazotrophicus TaxID=685 RepID=A0A2J8GZG0_VIBDI|nr:HAMP domain-containing sensor histidine kinase [Vibrio diazotrophicus]PNH91404.1 two-component sensor histidine kinase [Vibrio diazotrophicus]PNI06362.1 two-component sensor histidine kinase [Vibrio diazotrophicus]
MNTISFANTRTLTGQLALFFTGVALVMGLASYIIFYTALHWSEDKVGERRIEIDKNEAIARFMNGEQGKITIDVLTTAYNDISLVPAEYHKYFEGRDSFVGEVGSDPDSRMVFFSYYYKDGSRKPVILLSDINQIEFGKNETLFSGLIVVTSVAGLLLIFGGLLLRLSQRLIEPINNLTQQLTEHSGNAAHVFEIPSGGASEFKILADELNQYRHEIHSLIKREQAFARYASHELRTPLTIVKGASKLLERNASDDFQKRQIVRINEATAQMSTMVDALLGLVRYERSEEEAVVREVSKTEFETIIELNSAQAKDKDIDIALVFHQMPQLKAAPAVLNMVVGNLLRNAIAATHQGEITLEVSADSLCVRDNGPGLNQAKNQDGHGLGLLIVEDLCRRYHWHFSIKNRPTTGCEALISFGQ